MPAWFDTFFLAARPECRALRGVSKGAACKKHSPQPVRRSFMRRLEAGKLAGKFEYLYLDAIEEAHNLCAPLEFDKSTSFALLVYVLVIEYACNNIKLSSREYFDCKVMGYSSVT